MTKQEREAARQQAQMERAAAREVTSQRATCAPQKKASHSSHWDGTHPRAGRAVDSGVLLPCAAGREEGGRRQAEAAT